MEEALLALGSVYALGAAVVFVAGCFLCEKIEGRNCTGEPDFGMALFFAVIWPLLLAIIVWAFLAGRKPNQ